MMKLFYSGTSPYARIARISAGVCDVDHAGGHIASAQLRTDENPVLQYNCTGRVPTLVDGDTIVTETRAVCRYLEHVGNGAKLFAYAGEWPAEQFENTAMSLLDGCALWAREYRRDEALQSDWLVGVERNRANRCLDWFEAQPGIQSGDAPWDFAHIVLFAALDYQELRGLLPDWRDTRPNLANWHAAQLQRTSVIENANIGDP